MDADMPACDFARFGGNAGWRMLAVAEPLGARLGMAIEGYHNGEKHRNAVRYQPSEMGSAVQILKEWVTEVERDGR